MSAVQHKQTAARGGTVHYWVDRREGAECLVFTHGVTADHTMFEKQVERFAGRYTLILWDVPMHGLSRPYAGFSYRETAQILLSILDAEGIGQAFLVGMSMGGYPCQHFGALYPERVKGFVALDTTPLGLRYYSKADLWWLKRAAQIARAFPAGVLRWSMARSVSRTPYAYRKMMEMLAPLSKAEIALQMHIVYACFARENRDVAFPFPVLILVGERDRTGKVMAYCRAWAQHTGYPMQVIKDAAHFANGDQPQQVNDEIERFICKWAGRG